VANAVLGATLANVVFAVPVRVVPVTSSICSSVLEVFDEAAGKTASPDVLVGLPAAAAAADDDDDDDANADPLTDTRRRRTLEKDTKLTAD
jgi:hypothetical protein